MTTVPMYVKNAHPTVERALDHQQSALRVVVVSNCSTTHVLICAPKKHSITVKVFAKSALKDVRDAIQQKHARNVMMV